MAAQTGEARLSKPLENKRKYDEAMNQPYIDDGVLDPYCAKSTTLRPDIIAPQTSVLAREYAADVDKHLSWDIETYSTNMTNLMFGLVQHFEPDETQSEFSQPLKTWNEVAEWFEDYLYYESKKNSKFVGRVWAHNYEKFDGVGLAYSVEATDQLVNVDTEELIHDSTEYILHKKNAIKTELSFCTNQKMISAIEKMLDEMKYVVTKLEFDSILIETLHGLRTKEGISEVDVEDFMPIFRNHPTITKSKKVLRRGISLSDDKPLVRKRKMSNISPTGRKTNVTKVFNWQLVKRGNRALIEIKLVGGGTLQFYDSMWHIKGSLARHGDALGLPKGKTPLKNTRPKKWGRAQDLDFDIDDKANYEKWMDYWRNSITEDDVEYCKQDLRILTTLLKTYREEFMSLFEGIPVRKPLDPLEYMTCNAAGFSGMIAHIGSAARGQTDFTTVIRNPDIKGPEFSKWGIASDERLQNFILAHNPIESDIALSFGGDEPLMLRNGSFTVKQMFQQLWGHVAHGGRTEAFMLRTLLNHWSMTLDATSMYPSIMQDPECRFVDPNQLANMRFDVVGAENIRKYFRGNRSGMYLIETTEPTNEQVKKFPIFPVRLAYRDYDNSLVFPNWKGKMRLYVTGEELKYFINKTDVVDDDIRIIGKESVDAPLLNYDPMAAFIRKVFKKRKDARKNKKPMTAQLFKLIMNSSGFGTFAQINSKEFTMTVSNEPESMAKIDEAVKHLQRIAPDWEGWETEGWDDSAQSKVKLMKDWSLNHFKGFEEFRLYNGKKRVTLHLPNRTAPFAIRPWAYAVTAHARVRLHETICTIDSAGYAVEYCDTDSVHFSVPMEQSEEDVIDRLKDKIKIFDDLGGWKVEPPIIDNKLLNPKCDFSKFEEGYVINKPIFHCLAPKHYVLTDQSNNVLATTVKGVRQEMIKMRCALYSFQISSSSVGDKRGLRTQVRSFSDIEKHIQDIAKRNYHSVYKSEPILLKQPNYIPIVEHKDNIIELRTTLKPTYRDYKAAIATIEPETAGLTDSLIRYKSFNFNNQSYVEIRDEVMAAFRELSDINDTNLEDRYFDLIERLEGERLEHTDLIEEEEK